MNKLPLVVIRPNHSGLIRLNDSVIGHAGPKKPVSSPVHTDGSLYVIFTPLASRERAVPSPCAARIDFLEGKPSACTEFARVACWPGDVYEILIEPPLLMLPVSRLSEVYSVRRANWEPVRGRLLIVTVYQDNGLHLAVEDPVGNHLLFSLALGSGQPSIDFANTGGGPNRDLAVTIISPGKTRLVLVAPHENGFRLIFDETAARITRDGQRIVAEYDHESGADFPIKKVFELSDGLFRPVKALPGGETPGDRQQTALAFFEAVRLSMEEAALSYLTPSLRSGVTYDELSSFLGDFYAFGPPLFPTDCTNVQVALKYRGSQRIDPVRVFCVDLVSRPDAAGEWKIDNLREL